MNLAKAAVVGLALLKKTTGLELHAKKGANGAVVGSRLEL